MNQNIKKIALTLNNYLNKKSIHIVLSQHKSFFKKIGFNNKLNYGNFISISKRCFSGNLLTVKFPRTSESISEGQIQSWEKNVGDYVKENDLICQIQTDKANVDIRAVQDGKITKTFNKTGDTILVDQDLYILDTQAKPTKSDQVKVESPKKEAPKVVEQVVTPKIEKKEEIPKNNSQVKENEVKVKSSNPEKSNISFNMHIEDISHMRKQIINKLNYIQSEKAVLSTFNECDLTDILSLFKLFEKEFERKFKIKLLENRHFALSAMWVFAMTQAVKEYPIINSVIDTNKKNIINRNYIDMIYPVKSNGVSVNVIIRDCNNKTFPEILKEILRLQESANKNLIGIEDLQKGTIAINISDSSLLSSNSIEENTTVKLGINKIENRPHCVDNNPKRIEPRDIMMISLTYDHRLIDGREGVLFLKKCKEIMENPARLIFGV